MIGFLVFMLCHHTKLQGLQNFYLHGSGVRWPKNTSFTSFQLDSILPYEKFNRTFRIFTVCGIKMAVSSVRTTLLTQVILSILNSFVLGGVFMINIYKFTRENKLLLQQKVNSRCFYYFLATILQPTWHLHTELYKFVWNILKNNLSMGYHTDLRLGRIVYVFTFYNISTSWLHSLNGFDLIFYCMTVKTGNIIFKPWD